MDSSELLIFLTVVTVVEGLVPSASSTFRNYTLELFNDGKDYFSAKSDCEGRNAWLVEIKDEETQTAVMKLATHIIWIGLHYADQWKWNDITTLRYTNWAKSGPNEVKDDRNNECVSAQTSGDVFLNGKWSNVNCVIKYHYICQTDSEWTLLTFISSPLATFAQANDTCKNQGKSLVSVKSAELDAYIRDQLSGFEKNFWTSGNDLDNEGDWKWGDGTTIRRNNPGWKIGEPQGGGTENCLIYARYHQFKWVDFPCNRQIGYICEKDLSSGVCGSDICLNRGTCEIVGKRYNCKCNAGYFGTKCEKDLLLISTSNLSTSVKRGQSLNVQLTLTSYDGNVKVDVINSKNSVVRSKTTTGLSSSNTSINITINTGPIEVSSSTISYGFAATPTDTSVEYKRISTVQIDVTDACQLNPCQNGATCRYSTNEPFYTCNCLPAYNGSLCQERKFKTINKCKYHINHDDRKIFTEANSTCTNLGGSLAMVKTNEIRGVIEDQVLDQYGKANKPAISLWIGAYKAENDWLWFDGSKVRDGNWRNPSVKPGRGYLFLSSYLTTRDDMKLFNRNGSQKWGFVCEIPDVDVCKSAECSNRGKCIGSIGCQEICKCAPGYAGPSCENELIQLSAKKNNFTISIHESVNVTLVVHSFDGHVNIRLYKNNDLQNIVHHEDNVKASATFIIGPLNKMSDEIIYTFYASPSKSPQAYNFSTAVRVTVQAPASISTLQPLVTVIPVVNANNQIKCSASGVPIPSVQWYKDDNVVRRSESGSGIYQTVFAGKAILQVRKALSSDVGKYTCVATNVVQGVTTVTNKTSVVRGKIVNTDAIQSDVVSGSVNLTCTFQGYPTPIVIWKWKQANEIQILLNGNMPMFDIKSFRKEQNNPPRITSQLSIKLVEYFGLTTFSCLANNKYEKYIDNEKKFELNSYIAVNLNESYHMYGKIGSIKKNYVDAEDYCKSIQKRLVIISNNSTQMFLKNAAKKFDLTSFLYIGGARTNTSGQLVWMWNDGTMLYNETKHRQWNRANNAIVDETFVAWGSDRPTGAGNCLVMRHNLQWKWADVDCSTRRGYICEGPVAGIPDLSVSVDTCSSNLSIKWRPSADALGIGHRLEVVEAYEIQNVTMNITDITPTHQEKIFIRVTDLKHSTSYRVKIIVCPSCTIPYVESRLITTDATLPDPVNEIQVKHFKQNNTCQIFWRVNDNAHGIIDFQVETLSTIAHTIRSNSFNKTTEMVRVNVLERFYNLTNMQHNRKYTFGIRARTCAGFGPSSFAIGSCITDVAAPSVVHSPAVAAETSTDGTLTVTIPFPNESNGPISCLFLIVVYKPNHSKLVQIESVKELQNTTTSFIVNKGFIAIAISRTSISEINLTRILGDESTSVCNIYQIHERNRRKRDVDFDGNIRGKNFKLEAGVEYSYYTVTTTPGEDNEIFIKASEVSFFTSREMSNSMTIIIIIVIVGVVLIIFASTLFMFHLKRKNNKQKISSDNINLQDMPNNEEQAYENIAIDKREPRAPTDIALEQLLERYNQLKEKNRAKFTEEFQTLKQSAKALPYPTTVATSESLKKKNRYKNILPCDQSRVVLDGNGDDSYINGCYIHGFSQANKYIATQGPLPSTINDFWRMIVEKNVTCITMLTKCVENGKKKCEKYWPRQGLSKTYGNIHVENSAEVTTGCYKVVTLTVTKNNAQNKTVFLLQYLDWPDHGVPVTTSNLLRFHKIFQSYKSDAPSVIHCSAGAGRTGAFIAFDFLLDESKSLGTVDVHNCILKLRKQRVDMVQTCDQYILVHKLILEEYLFGNTDLDSDKLYQFMDNASSKQEAMEKQFNNLQKVGPINQAKQREVARNQDTVRNKDVIPYSRRNHVVVLRKSTDSETPYLNASNLESYGNITKLIAAQGPFKSTVEIFWRAIFDNNVNTIVMLTNCKENKKEQCFQYWPKELEKDLILGDINVYLKSTESEHNLICRQLRVTKEDDEKVVIQYQYTGWKTNECPSDSTEIFELIEKMYSSLRRDKDAASLIHCSDGAGRTGSFCALINLIERLKSENKIDVFRAVKDLRDCRPGMVQTFEQYKFLYDAISTYLATFNLYYLYSNIEITKKPQGSQEESLYANI